MRRGFTAEQAERSGAVAEVLPLDRVPPRAREIAEAWRQGGSCWAVADDNGAPAPDLSVAVIGTDRAGKCVAQIGVPRRFKWPATRHPGRSRQAR
jgi:enoyl-CoA hydratase/carnithine racemase